MKITLLTGLMVLSILKACQLETSPNAGDDLVDRNPVLFVHGYGMNSSFFDDMLNFLRQEEKVPAQFLRAIDIKPASGANIDAAVNQIQPAVERLLSEANSYLATNRPESPQKTRVNIVSHSMGSLSSRWYAARIRPDRVHTWISLAGANHGSNVSAFAGESTDAERDMYPAFAASEQESYIQFHLNGTPSAPGVDETPYGRGRDRKGVVSVPPDSRRSILYITIAAAPGDEWIEPDSSVQLDGAGGIPITLPADIPVREVSPGNYQMTNGVRHDPMLSDPQVFRLVGLLLNLKH